MKRVDIISKVVGRDSSGKPVGGGISIPMGNYALKSDFESLKSMFNDFLEGDDTDSVINRWKDLKAFLNGISEEDPLTSILGNYIPISGYTEIVGEKNFIGGLKVNGSPIYYDTEKKYWKLEGDLLVTGGVTMYGNDSDFVPSTIMDAILYDSNTLGINANGQLYVKGSVSGATTMGSLSNVGSWADSVASQDRIMYQAANSSQWVAKNLSDLAVGGVTGNYLPLNMTSTPFVVNTQSGVVNFKSTSASEVGFRLYFGDSNKGGLWANDERIYLYHAPTGNSVALSTNGRLIFKAGGVDYTVLHSNNYSSYALPLTGGLLSNSVSKILELNTTGTVEVGMRFSMSSVAKGWVGYSPSEGTILYNNTSLASFGVKDDGALFYSGGTIWHSGNDGSGSGLDADLLDGKHYSDIINGNVASATRIQAYQHNSDAKTIISGTRTDNTFPRSIYDNGWALCVKWQDSNGVVHNGTIATLNDNVASATKLQTARTIWGQSFDGTGNVDGALTINKATTSSGDYGACVLINGTYAETGFHRALSYENQKMVVGSTAAMYVGAKNTQYNGGFLGFKYVSANSSSNYMSIGLYAANDLLCVLGNGNVGIGTTNPSHPLAIVSTKGDVVSIKTTSDTWSCIRYYPRSGTNWSVGCDNTNVFFFYSDNAGKYISTISANGDLWVNGGFTMYSDIRKKTKLKDVVLSLQQVANAPLIEHYYNSDQNKTTHVGSIAQYWAEMNDWFCKKDSEGYYTMEIQNAALASAISVARELVKFESETDKRIRLLEDENKRLKEEVEQLKWNIA